jgi:hypothetical protein
LGKGKLNAVLVKDYGEGDHIHELKLPTDRNIDFLEVEGDEEP